MKNRDPITHYQIPIKRKNKRALRELLQLMVLLVIGSLFFGTCAVLDYMVGRGGY